MSEQKLYMIPIVIADNTESDVITDQVRHVISSLDYFLVENVRTTRRYISKLRLGLVIEDLKFDVLDKKTKPDLIRSYFEKARGKNIGVISESGCPGIADPGANAVVVAHEIGMKVVPLSGPSSIFMALMASGFNGQSFVFHGYVPIDKKDRENKIRSMEETSSRLNQTQLFMDTPYRNQKLFEYLIKICRPHTLLSIAKGITGDGEMILTKSIRDWKKTSVDLHKIPTIFSIYS